jgi:CUB/sushi domain-containing protein
MGSPVRLCQSDGVWSGVKPYCKNKFRGCRELLAPRFSSMFVLSTSVNTGQKVEFVCDDGYVMYGENVLTCVDGDEWDHVVPRCEPQLCISPAM